MLTPNSLQRVAPTLSEAPAPTKGRSFLLKLTAAWLLSGTSCRLPVMLLPVNRFAGAVFFTTQLLAKALKGSARNRSKVRKSFIRAEGDMSRSALSTMQRALTREVSVSIIFVSFSRPVTTKQTSVTSARFPLGISITKDGRVDSGRSRLSRLPRSGCLDKADQPFAPRRGCACAGHGPC